MRSNAISTRPGIWRAERSRTMAYLIPPTTAENRILVIEKPDLDDENMLSISRLV